ncbi:hypothetical protein BLX87_17885 [Bacillus sp. VT-16-64]|nr:hypothetical protein BLX87_17885 [Bacillus sp. VT-16-64]
MSSSAGAVTGQGMLISIFALERKNPFFEMVAACACVFILTGKALLRGNHQEKRKFFQKK